MPTVDLSIRVLFSGHIDLIAEYLKKVTATKSAMSFLLYKFIIEIRKTQIAYMAYDNAIERLVSRGARFTTKVVRSDSIFTWALIHSYWDIAGYALSKITKEEFLSSDDVKPRFGKFEFEAGIQYWPFETLYEYALTAAPADFVVSMIEKGFRVKEVSQGALTWLRGDKREAVVKYFEREIEEIDKEMKEDTSDGGREAAFRRGRADFKLTQLKEKLGALR